MTNYTIADRTAITVPATTDEYEVQQSGDTATKKATAVQVLTGALGTKTANTVLAGPTAGGAAAPAFRALVAADLPGAGVNTAIYDISAGVPANSGFSWLNQGGASVSEVSGKALIITGTTSSTSDNMRVRYKAVPSTPYTITFLVQAAARANSNQSMGVCFTDGTKIQALSIEGTTTAKVQVNSFTNATTYASTQGTAFELGSMTGFIFLQLADDGTNVAFRFSVDGVNFLTYYSVAKASGFLGGSGYTNVGFYLNDNQNSLAPIATLRLWDTGTRAFP